MRDVFVVVSLCQYFFHREIITSRFAPEYFPNIPPSVEYLAEDVPVPIPKPDNKTSVHGIFYMYM